MSCQIEVDCEVRWCKARKNKGAGLLKSDKCGKRVLILSDCEKRPEDLPDSRESLLFLIS